MRRNPGPPDNGVPNPPAIGVRSPGGIVHRRNPHITIRRFIHPSSVVGEFGFVFVKFIGKITFVHRAGLQFITGTAPIRKTVIILSVVIT
jgi:hypothetical protein